MKNALFILLFSVLACSPVYKTDYEFIPPLDQMGKICANQCIQTKNMCMQNCSLQEQNCEMRADLEAELEYNRYLREREAEGKPVNRSINSFKSTSSCNISKCENNCTESHNLCYTNCGGKVIPHTRCTAFCEE